MRQDQLVRLLNLSEKVGEVFLEEADPDNWNGSGTPMSEMDAKLRGDRLWDKKNAVQTGALLARILDLADRDIGRAPDPKEDDDTEQEISRYERKAKELIGAIQNGARK